MAKGFKDAQSVCVSLCVVHTKLKCTWRHDVSKSISLEWKSSDFFYLLVINECI